VPFTAYLAFLIQLFVWVVEYRKSVIRKKPVELPAVATKNFGA
jgi:hypothetical protein